MDKVSVDPVALSLPRFSPEADEFLKLFYAKVGAITVGQKIEVLTLKLGPSNFYAFGGEVTDEMRLGCLEYELLLQEGLLQLEEDLLF